MTTLAVDVGGTKIEAAIVDDLGNVHARAREATASVGAEGPNLAERLVALCGRVRREARLVGLAEPVRCGIGCGGPMARNGVHVSPLNIVEWRNFALLEFMTSSLRLPVAIDNDAKALALAEGWLGGAKGVDNYLAMVVSTGVGAGIVVDGRLLDGASGNAGHIGHVIVEPEGRLCACGSRGCLEAEASGPSIEAWTGLAAAEATSAVRRVVGTLVGRAVASAVSLLDLRLALVGGSVALGFGEEFFAAANAELEARARIEFARGVRIEPVALGDRAPLIGAAAVALRPHIGARPGPSADR